MEPKKISERQNQGKWFALFTSVGVLVMTLNSGLRLRRAMTVTPMAVASISWLGLVLSFGSEALVLPVPNAFLKRTDTCRFEPI